MSNQAPNATQFPGPPGLSFDWATGSVPSAVGQPTYSQMDLNLARSSAAPISDNIVEMRQACAELVNSFNKLGNFYANMQSLGAVDHDHLPPFPMEGTNGSIKLVDLDAGLLLLPLVLAILSSPLTTLTAQANTPIANMLAALAASPHASVAPITLARRLQS